MNEYESILTALDELQVKAYEKGVTAGSIQEVRALFRELKTRMSSEIEAALSYAKRLHVQEICQREGITDAAFDFLANRTALVPRPGNNSFDLRVIENGEIAYKDGTPLEMGDFITACRNDAGLAGMFEVGEEAAAQARAAAAAKAREGFKVIRPDDQEALEANIAAIASGKVEIARIPENRPPAPQGAIRYDDQDALEANIEDIASGKIKVV